MIVGGGEDKKGKFYKLGMIDRAALALENYAASEFGNRFYQDDYLRGLCERRNEIHAQVTKATAGVVISTTLLAFFDNIQGTTMFWGISFSVPEIGAFALCVLTAVNFLAFSFAIIDQLIVDRFIYTLGARIGVHSFELFLLNHTAKNLWTIATTPRSFGLVSGTGHKSVQSALAVFYLVIGLCFLAYPLSVFARTATAQEFSSLSMVASILLLISATIMICAILFLLAFTFTYKFRPSVLPEPSEPFVPENFLDLGSPWRNREDTTADEDANKP